MENIFTRRNSNSAINEELQLMRGRYIAEKAMNIVNTGDTYLTQILLVEAMPHNLNHPDRPYAIELEAALRNASRLFRTVQRLPYALMSVKFSPDGNHLAIASEDAIVRILDVSTGVFIRELNGHKALVSDVAYSPDGNRVVSASNDRTVRLWDVESGTCVFTMRGHTDLVRTVAFPQQDSRDNTVRVWNLETGVLLYELLVHVSIVNSLSFNNDADRIVSTSVDGYVRVWNVCKDKQRVCVKEPELAIKVPHVNHAVFSPEGKCIAKASGDSFTPLPFKDSDNDIRIWNVNTGQCQKVQTGHTKDVVYVSFSPDSTHLVSASYDSTVRLWDVRTGQCLWTSDMHPRFVNSATFSPDGRCIVSSSMKTVFVWDVASGLCLQTIRVRVSDIKYSTFSQDGRRILSFSYSNIASISDFLPLQELIDLANDSFKNNPLTLEERKNLTFKSTFNLSTI